MEPKLFPSLKEWVRVHKKPGQFVLSGSVRLTSRKAIRESLAGRMALIEMFPFSVAEIEERTLPEVVPNIFFHKIFTNATLGCLNPSKQVQRIKKAFETYLKSGGLPGICFIRSPDLKSNALSELHDLILARDLKLVSDVNTSITTIKKLMSYIAKMTFEPYNASEVRRLLGLAPQTQKKLLYAMESIFLIRRIPVPLRKKEIILLEDQFEELTYAAGELDDLKQIESAVYRNVRTQFGYRLDKNVQFESHLTRDHARVPIVIKKEGNILGIIVITTAEPSLSQIRSATRFLRHYASSHLIYLSTVVVDPRVIDDRTMISSIYAVI